MMRAADFSGHVIFADGLKICGQPYMTELFTPALIARPIGVTHVATAKRARPHAHPASRKAAINHRADLLDKGRMWNPQRCYWRHCDFCRNPLRARTIQNAPKLRSYIDARGPMPVQ